LLRSTVPELDEGERLQKVLARTGFGSRRVCEDLIADGRVAVDGEVAILGRRVDPDAAQITVDGVPIPTMPGLVHYLLNKPAKVVCTAADTAGRTTVVELVPSEPRVFSVGRLDYETEGLLLLTNDGAFAQALTHPSHGVEKEYLAHVGGGPVSPVALRQLREGVPLDDGMTAPAKVAELGDGLLKIVIHEGRNRQVRRMCEAVGHPVLRLVRTRIGNLVDAKLKPGEWRALTLDEVLSLGEVAVKGRQPTRKGAMRGTTIRS
jgi:23S rRNA pseudouridine2605 synthase